MKEQKPYIIVGKIQFFAGLIVGFVILLFGVYYMNINQVIGSGILGIGLAMCLLLLEQKLNSIGKI